MGSVPMDNVQDQAARMSETFTGTVFPWDDGVTVQDNGLCFCHNVDQVRGSYLSNLIGATD